MKSNKYEYFLNAIHYTLWRNQLALGGMMKKIVHKLISPIFPCPDDDTPERKKVDKLFNDPKNGTRIGWANHWFGYLYSGYPIFLSYILLGIANQKYGKLDTLVVAILMATPIGLCYIPAYKAVFSNDRYLKFFKQFKKKDEHWHRKWKWITFVFSIGALTITFLGISVAYTIASFF